MDPIKAKHELIGLDKTLFDLLGAFKRLENNPLGAQVTLTGVTAPKDHWVGLLDTR